MLVDSMHSPDVIHRLRYQRTGLPVINAGELWCQVQFLTLFEGYQGHSSQPADG